jgi:hypothetical protein
LNVQHNYEALAELINPASYLKRPVSPGEHLRWVNSVETAIQVAYVDDLLFRWRGRPVNMWEMCLNTAARIGNDALRLAARIHGQCEIHCYVEGINRWWLADVIDSGLDAGVLRQLAPYFKTACDDTGQWESVTRLLRDRDDEPVVLSYSICEQFPNPDAANWCSPYDDDDTSDARRELWDELPDDEQWQIALQALRQRGGGLELQPADWDTFYFGSGLTALDLTARDWRDRLDERLEVTA